MTALTANRLEALKESGEDFEWYPTTPSIIRKVARDIRVQLGKHYHRQERLSVLDIGAGDGRVLTGISEELHDEEWYRSITVDAFAIEKSTTHLTNMPKDVVVIGTDFHEQTLVDKPAGVVFCNPPYSEYEAWATRILRECCTENIYLVIPRRWRDSAAIAEVIALREIEIHSLGEFDFENAERQARAKVEVVRFHVEKHDSAFDAAIESMLPELEHFDREPEAEKAPEFNANLIGGDESVIVAMVSAYDAELAKLADNYRAVVRVDPAVLKELGVSKKTILEGIRRKSSGLKNKYWKALFEYLGDVTKRLATKQRKEFLDSLTDKVVIDFTEQNVYAMLVWITKWASSHFDDQLIELFKAMAQKATVEKYKSNQKVFADRGWRYLNDEASHYKLCYRMVLETGGGICTSAYSWQSVNGLAESSYHLLSDFITVANNLGYECDDRPENYEWKSNRRWSFASATVAC